MSKQKNIIYFIIFILLYVFLSLFIVNIYVSKETLADNYRFYAYHYFFIDYMSVVKQGLYTQWIVLREHLATSNSSFFSVILLSNIGVFFGKSRQIFISLLTLVYLLPSVLLTFFIYKKKFTTNARKSTLLDITMLFLLGSNVFYWFPVLRGMPDIAALIPFSLLVYVFLSFRFEKIFDIKKIMLIAILMFITFLMRRTFAPALFTLVLTTFLIKITNVFLFSRKDKIIKLFVISFNMLIPSILFMIFLYFIMHNTFEYVIDGRMIAECNIYNSSDGLISVLHSLKGFFSYIGVVYWFFIIFGICISIKRKENLSNMIFCLLFILLYQQMFLKIQDILFENILCVAFFLLLLMLLGIDYFLGEFSVKKIRNIILCVLLISFSALNFKQFFFIENRFELLDKLFSVPIENSTPLRPIFYDKFLEVYNILIDEYKKDPTYTFSSLSEDRLFDPETINYYSLIKNNKEFIDRVKNIIAPNTYGLSFEGYNADYLIVITPWMSELFKKGWLPLSIPYEDFVNNKGISKYYTKFYEIELKEEHQKRNLIIYKKTDIIPPTEMCRYVNKFKELYDGPGVNVEEQLKEYLLNTISSEEYSNFCK